MATAPCEFYIGGTANDPTLQAPAALPGVDALNLAGDVDTVLAGGVPDAPSVLDVHEIPHGRRHPRIVARGPQQWPVQITPVHPAVT